MLLAGVIFKYNYYKNFKQVIIKSYSNSIDFFYYYMKCKHTVWSSIEKMQCLHKEMLKKYKCNAE